MIKQKDSIVFRPGRIGNIELKNRLVRSATYDNAATAEGRATEKMRKLHPASPEIVTQSENTYMLRKSMKNYAI